MSNPGGKLPPQGRGQIIGAQPCRGSERKGPPGVAVHEPIPQHAHPSASTRHLWPSQGNSQPYYQQGPPPASSGTSYGFPRDIFHMDRHRMHAGNPPFPSFNGYPPHTLIGQPPLPPPASLYPHPPPEAAGVATAVTVSYYGLPPHPSGVPQGMNHAYGNPYQYEGHPSQIHQAPPPFHPHPPHMPYQGQSYPGSLNMPPAMGEAGPYGYPPPDPQQHAYQYPAISSSFSADSRSTLGLSDPVNHAPGGMIRHHTMTKFPTHVGLRSIAHDTTTSPSPPPIPPSTVILEPHQISAPNSLDEAEGGPLRHTSIMNQRNSVAAVSAVPKEMGSSEKRETLDTASVLLAFSATKKRPSSTTSTIDDTDALSLATMSTLPHSVAPPDYTVTSCPPTDYPKRLAMPEDRDRLNELHCYMRSDLLEIVVIQPSDGANTNATDSYAKIPTSKDPQQIGRVGLRCVHCSMSPDGGRSGPSMSIFYPKSLEQIYRLVTSWKRCHMSKCKNIPKSVRDVISRLSTNKNRGKTSYWSESAAQLGLVNMPTKIGGICFFTTSNYIRRSDSMSPARLTLSMTASEPTTDAHSPDTVPTISDASTFVSNTTKDVSSTKFEA